MVDGYTTMANFPYSQRKTLSSLTADSLATTSKTAKQPNDQINYIRNSVKATVDAYTGKVTLYAWDPTDPVLKAWTSVFPGLVQPRSRRCRRRSSAHVRYPEDLFKVQRSMLGKYHVDNPVTFYNVERQMDRPDDDPNDAPERTSRRTTCWRRRRHGSRRPEPQFQLTTPMNVNSSTYLAAYHQRRQ